LLEGAEIANITFDCVIFPCTNGGTTDYILFNKSYELLGSKIALGFQTLIHN